MTDHKPLLGLLGEHKPTSPQASARIRRWSLYLSTFEYNLKFRWTGAHANADALSWLPLQMEPATQTPPELVLLTDHIMADFRLLQLKFVSGPEKIRNSPPLYNFCNKASLPQVLVKTNISTIPLKEDRTNSVRGMHIMGD